MKKITILFLCLLHFFVAFGQEVTIGTGTATFRQPLSNWYGFERSAALYTAAEIGRTGYINEIAWSIGTIRPARPIKIYLKEVDATSLTATNWSTFIQGATLMYDGPFTPTVLGFNPIVFDESFPFLTPGKSLLVLVEANVGGSGNGDGIDGLRIAHSPSAAMHFTASSDSNAPTSNLASSSQRPNIRLTFGPRTSCFSPVNPQAEFIGRTTTVRLSWTPRGDERVWEVYTIEQGQPEPTATTVGIRVEDIPMLLLENVEEEKYFKFYVRAVCQGEDGITTTKWVGPVAYSFFTPPMCADLDIEVEGVEPSATDIYYLCGTEPITRRLKMDVVDIKMTDKYRIESIDYDPPFPFVGGSGISMTADDIWSNVINLGFDFCFYGKKFNKALVSTNGAVSFSIKNEVPGGMYRPNTFSAWQYSQSLPFIQNTDSFGPFVDAVFGVYQDLYPNTSPPDYSFNYQVLGNYPCRALVVNMYHMGLFNVPFNPNDIEGSTQTSQIILYEGTNIIDVYVKNRPVNLSHNSGNGLIGIQGRTTAQFQVPPGRNTGPWTTRNEAWRFIPDGESTVQFQWYKNGEPFSKSPIIDVVISEEVIYTAKAIYSGCEVDDFIVERTISFLREDFEIPTLTNIEVCGHANDPQGKVNIDLIPKKTLIIEAINTHNNSNINFDIEYYKDEELTIPMSDVIAVSGKEKIYVKVINRKTKCEKVSTFQAIRSKPIEVTTLNTIEACESYVLPELKEGEMYYDQPQGQGVSYQGGERYAIKGDSVLYIYQENEFNCWGQSEFKLTLYESITADVIADQRLLCQNFVLPELSTGNTYHTEPQGKGMELKAGTIIFEPTTLYIYVHNGGKEVFCSDESSFKIQFDDCPIPKGISPNGDGINDTFDLSDYGIAKIQIFNRNGVEVYSHGPGYTNQWEGQDKSGNKLPAATYYYILISHGKQRTGWVQLNY